MATRPQVAFNFTSLLVVLWPADGSRLSLSGLVRSKPSTHPTFMPGLGAGEVSKQDGGAAEVIGQVAGQMPDVTAKIEAELGLSPRS